MKNKYIARKVIPSIIIIVLIMSGIISVNIKNTNALSPLGNTNENYALVSEEFGNDFSNFIKDNSFLKIYKEDNDILVRIGENNFRITNQSNITKQAVAIFDNIKERIGTLKKS